MIDFKKIEEYTENNRIEAKKALGGLPHSIWETYSAFANTLGGIILLGVEEYRDKSFHTVDLPDPEGMIKEFWTLLNDAKKVSVNILTKKDITVEKVDGKRIVAIRVPRAKRYDKPVFIDGDRTHGSYRRSGEGDYRCTPEEVEAMVRDAKKRTQDMASLKELDLSALDSESIYCYRQRAMASRPDHTVSNADDASFLCALGAAEKTEDGKLYPTVAGLLMFGKSESIKRAFPFYSLEYDGESPIVTSQNIYGFYFDICQRLTANLSRQGEVAQAICEAFSNCLVNADYFSGGAITVSKKDGCYIFSNPGSFRIDVNKAKSGGHSDPRNSALTRMFNLISVGNGTGSGIPNIFSVWKKAGYDLPTITESFEPDRITITLPTTKSETRKARPTQRSGALKKAMMIEYLTEHTRATEDELASFTDCSRSLANKLLGELMKDKVIAICDDGSYKLRA